MERRPPIYVYLGKDGAFYSRNKRYSGEAAKVIAMILAAQKKGA